MVRPLGASMVREYVELPSPATFVRVLVIFLLCFPVRLKTAIDG
jgi:hypothetical protein